MPSPEKVVEFETGYLPQGLKRDYEHTFGRRTRT